MNEQQQQQQKDNLFVEIQDVGEGFELIMSILSLYIPIQQSNKTNQTNYPQCDFLKKKKNQ